MDALAVLSLGEETDYELINGREVQLAAAGIPHLDVQGNLYQTIKNYWEGL